MNVSATIASPRPTRTYYEDPLFTTTQGAKTTTGKVHYTGEPNPYFTGHFDEAVQMASRFSSGFWTAGQAFAILEVPGARGVYDLVSSDSPQRPWGNPDGWFHSKPVTIAPLDPSLAALVDRGNVFDFRASRAPQPVPVGATVAWGNY